MTQYPASETLAYPKQVRAVLCNFNHVVDDRT